MSPAIQEPVYAPQAHQNLDLILHAGLLKGWLCQLQHVGLNLQAINLQCRALFSDGASRDGLGCQG